MSARISPIILIRYYFFAFAQKKYIVNLERFFFYFNDENCHAIENSAFVLSSPVRNSDVRYI